MSDGVVVLLSEKEDNSVKYLMVQDAYGPYEGRWAPVHGGVEDGESVEEAVRR